MNTAEKVRENRLRRAADRRGLRLSRSRRRDPLALDYGQYTLTNRRDQIVRRGSLDKIERWLEGGTR